MSKDYHWPSAPSVLSVVNGNHPFEAVEGGGTTNVYFLSLQHPNHPIEIGRIDPQVTPAVSAVDEEVEIKHVLYHTNYAEVEAVGRIQIGSVVMGQISF